MAKKAATERPPTFQRPDVVMVTLDSTSSLIAGLAGGIVASFIVTAAMRSAEGDSPFLGRSHCDHCATQLGYLQTIPVISYVSARGRCGRCGAAISTLHILGEVVGVSAAVSIVVLLPMAYWPWAGALASALLFVGAYDALTMRIPNLANLMIGGLGLLFAQSEGRLVAALAVSILTAVLLLAIHHVFTRVKGRSGIGMGDVKLIAVLSLWTGAERASLAVLMASVLGLVWLLAQGRLRSDQRVPFAPAIATGFWLTFVTRSVM